MIFDEGKNRVLLDPNVYLVKLDNKEPFLKRHEWQLNDWQENASFIFKVDRDFEVSMISEGFEDRMSFEMFSNLVLVDSNLDEIRCMKLVS